MFAQKWIHPSGADPVQVACPKGPITGTGIDPFEAWRKANELMHIEGDGPIGTTWGHTREALEWYCKAAAAGGAIAAGDIGDITGAGYVVNLPSRRGIPQSENYSPDAKTALYWHQRAADLGFTKSMISVAEVYAAGVVVPQDGRKALNLLTGAATIGDTEALLFLSSVYAGISTGPLARALPIVRDDEKAKSLGDKARGIFRDFDSMCTGASAIIDMVNQLPNASNGRIPEYGVTLAVHGVTGPQEIDCALHLGSPPQRDDRPATVDGAFAQILSGLPRTMQGASVGAWKYKITRFPGIKGDVLSRQIAAEAIGENIEEMERLLNRLLNPSPEPRR